MTLREAAEEVAQVLHRLPEVTRVLLTGRDGLPVFDDLALADREHGAAATAAALGVAGVVADTLRLGPSRGSIVVGDESVVVIRPLESGHAIAVVAAVSVDVGDLHRRVRKHARELELIVAEGLA